MSANMAAQETRTVNFAVSGALGDEVLGTDGLTLQGFTVLAAPNAILRAIIDIPTGRKFDIILKRDGKEVRRWPSDLLSAAQQGPVFPGFPLPVRAGSVQFYAEQKSGGLTACTVYFVWSASLVTVVS